MNMQDRELLEFAAKAIGKVFVDPMSWDDGAGWNPLEDDGDALRLLVDIRMDIRQASDAILIWHPKCGEVFSSRYPHDRHAATRIAIVRAAAEIGKAMQEQPK